VDRFRHRDIVVHAIVNNSGEARQVSLTRHHVGIANRCSVSAENFQAVIVGDVGFQSCTVGQIGDGITARAVNPTGAKLYGGPKRSVCKNAPANAA
jgi:hypothetical protein